MKKPVFVSGEIYHLYNRGVEKRDIFIHDKDRTHLVYILHEFNNTESVDSFRYRRKLPYEVQPRTGDELVEILAFCLMTNHFHLLVRQKQEKGIVRYMQKLGTGYTMYFNKKYERVGPLFQGRFKAVLVQKDLHLRCLVHYIHFNPLDFVEPGWREQKIRSHKDALTFLRFYRWSSFRDYIGESNFPFVTIRDFIWSLFGGPKGYEREVTQWLKNMDFETARDFLLE